jgi:regulator of replication initiation timing
MLLSIDVGIRNLAMCQMNHQTIRRWEVAGVPPESESGLYKQLCEHLDQREWLADSTTVLIEKQPDRNKKMKSVENFLHAYFVIKGKPVVIWDAKYKIPDIVGPGKEQYRRRKAASVERCRKFLQDTAQTDWLRHFEASNKKDDLADTVMQALSYQPKELVATTKKCARRPTPNQKETKYSKANLAWLYKEGQHLKDRRFQKDLTRYYSGLPDLLADFGLQ